MNIGSLVEINDETDRLDICAVLEELLDQLWDVCYQQPKDLKAGKVREQRAAHITKLNEFGVVKEIDAAD